MCTTLASLGRCWSCGNA